MIYLITGTPGTGKTALAVSMIINNKDGLFKMTLDDGTEVQRPLYFCHIDGLDFKKLKAHELTEAQIQSAPLKELVPTGSVVVVDEADYTYPTRPSAREVPPYIKTLKELRHEGFTLILMTQHPTMLDSYLRNLVGKHWHLERKQVGTKLYEFNKCVTNLDSPSAISGAISEFYKPDKKAFEYYKSASMHVKFNKRKHPIFYGVFLALLVLPFFFYYAYSRLSNFTNPSGTDLAITAPPAEASAPQQSYNTGQQATEERRSLTPQDYVPTLPEKPESKPLYDGIRQVKQFEYVAGCVMSAKSCNCYSAQATKLDIPDYLCRDYAANGLPFNPWIDPPQPPTNAEQGAAGSQAIAPQPAPPTESMPEKQRIAAITAMANAPPM